MSTVGLIVVKEGVFLPASDLERARLRKMRLATGTVVEIRFNQVRNSRQWVRAHKLGQLVVENIEGFEGMDAHGALKRLQGAAGAACDEYPVVDPKTGEITSTVRVPRTLAFGEMEETEFQEVLAKICQYLIDTYWQGLEQYQIEDMSGLVGLAA